MRDHLNEVFQNTSDNFEVNVDPSEIWKGIEVKMGEPKKKRFAWLWLTGLFIFVATLFGAYFILDQSSLENKTNNTISENKTINQKNLIEKSIELNAKDEEETLKVNSDKIKKEIEQTVIASNIESQKIIESPSEITIQNQNLDPSNSFEKIQSGDNKLSSSPLLQLKKSIVFNSTVLTNERGETNSNVNPFKKETKLVEATRRNIGLNPIDLLSANALAINNEKIALQVSTSEFVPIKQIEKIKTERSMFKSLQMFGSFGYFSKSYQSTSDDFNEYASLRDQSETTLEYWSYGMTIGIYQRNNFEFYSGFRHTRLNEEFKWKGSYVETEEGSYPTGLTINSQGDTIVTASFEGLVMNNIDRDMIIYNAFKLFDIPLGVRYYRNNGANGFLAEAEYLWNISLNSRGYILNERGVPMNMANQGFRSKINGSMRFGLGYMRALGSNWDVKISGEVNYIPNNFNGPTLPIKTTRILYGLNVGLNYRLL